MRTALLILLLAPQSDGWWNKDWSHRRRIEIKNNLDGPLKAGYPLQVEFDADYLGVREKAKADLSDLALVHGGRRVPFALLPGRSKGRHVLCFRTESEIRGGGRDGDYALYYGNPAPPPPPAGEPVFDFFEDFSRPEAFRERFEADKDIALSVQDGALVIRDVAVGRTENTPARILLKALPSSSGFALSFDLQIDSTHAAALGFALNVDMKEPGVDNAGVAKKIDDLIEKLGDADWEVREGATKELIKIGKAAVSKLAAAGRSSDAEVRWRAEHVLKEIRERAAAPTISAGITAGDGQVGPIALSSIIGKSRAKARYGGGWPLRLHVTVLRAPEGEVTVLWNNGKPQTGHLPGEVREIYFTVYKGAAAPLGTIRVHNLLLRRYVDDDSRPTHTLEVEESRP